MHEQGGVEIGIEDYMVKLLATREMQEILTHFGRSTEVMRELLTVARLREGSSSRPVFSPLLIGLLQEGYLLVSLELKQKKVGVGGIVLALLLNPARYSTMPFYQELGRISADALRRQLEGLHHEEAERQGAKAGGSSSEDFLARYTMDFTEAAKAGKSDLVFARGPEIRQMIDILTRRRKNNPILVGDPGVGKTAVVEGLAMRVVDGLVPECLKGVRIVGLDMGRLQAGASVKGEFEKRLKGVIDEITSSLVPTILFIDEAHALVGSGNAAGSSDGANLLKPVLARGEMRTIAATTWSEYKKYLEKDAALARRFQLVKLGEPTVSETVTILRGIVPHYERSHNVYVRDDAVLWAAELSSRYISGRQLPDKAIDLLDTACARVRVSLGARPAVLEDLEEELASCRRELGARERDCAHNCRGDGVSVDADRNRELLERICTLDWEVEQLAGRWASEKALVDEILRSRREGDGGVNGAWSTLGARLDELQAGKPMVFHEVTPGLIRNVVSEWTGIPAAKLGARCESPMIMLGESLRQRVRGQEHALKTIEQAVLTALAGLNNPASPTGIFLLVGPSGVGKTETALALADALFGGERMLISINMSEFQEKHTVSRLIGSPPGYVGYGEGGRLTEAVRRQPYSAVLFDEVEKAHPDVLNLFYQVFDKGVLADGEGREIDFRNCIILMTSNLGSEIVTALCQEEEQPAPEALKEALRPVLTRFFQPALLGRMTIVPYTTINSETLKELVELKLVNVGERIGRRYRLGFSWDDDVLRAIMASCTALETGARNIDHIIQSSLLPGMAKTILWAWNRPEAIAGTLHVRLGETDGNFIFEMRPQHG
jgi:type VI secretion system protein VasG